MLYLLSLSPLLHTQNFKEGLVTLTFDDGYACHHETLLPLLEKYGMSATFYITTSLLGEPRYLTREQVIELSQRGHEIASHGITHQSLKKLSLGEVERELKESKKELENLIQAPVTHFAPPFGESTPSSLHFIKRYYKSCRTIRPGMNVEKLNPYVICGYVVRNSTSLREIRKWLQEARTEKKWLVLIYHQINDTQTIVSVSAKTFENHLQEIQKQCIRTVPIGKAFKM